MSLSKPISPRSHFLPQSPIVGLSDSYREYEQHGLEAHTLLHEYLHYEDFTSWPILLVRYYLQAMNAVRVVAGHLGHSLTIQNPVNNAVDLLRQYRFESTGWDETKVAAKQPPTFRIGLSALPEASALLNFYVKPLSNPLREVSIRVLETLFHEREQGLNRTHIIGVESALAVVGLGNRHFREVSSNDLFQLAALLPGIIGIKAMARALIETLGLDSDKLDYRTLTLGIERSLHLLITNYFKHFDTVLDLAFRNRDPGCLAAANERDFAVVGTHALISAIYRQMCGRPDIFRLVGYLEAAALEPLLYLIKLYEAYYHPTLARHGAGPLRPLWLPVTTLIFADKEITSLRLDFLDAPAGFFKLRFHYSIKTPEEHFGLLAWLKMAFLVAMAFAIDLGRSNVTCPLYEWVERQYASIGVRNRNAVDKHVQRMCGVGLTFDYENRPYGSGVAPSEEYCQLAIPPEPAEEAESRCYFRSIGWHMLMNTKVPSKVDDSR